MTSLLQHTQVFTILGCDECVCTCVRVTVCPHLPDSNTQFWMQGVVHGCPYKSFDTDSVRAALDRLRIEPDKVRAAVGKMQGGHYQLACAAAWEGAHGCECVTGINHPNQVQAAMP